MGIDDIASYTPSMPNLDLFSQSMALSVAGLTGFIGAVFGLFIVMLISSKYEDWGKTLAPTYFILSTLGMAVNPLALILSAIWFAIVIWNNTGWSITQIPNLMVNKYDNITADLVRGDRKLNRKIDRIDRTNKKQSKLDKVDENIIKLGDKKYKGVNELNTNSLIEYGNIKGVSKDRKQYTKALLKQKAKDDKEKAKLLEKAGFEEKLNRTRMKANFDLQDRKDLSQKEYDKQAKALLKKKAKQQKEYFNTLDKRENSKSIKDSAREGHSLIQQIQMSLRQSRNNLNNDFQRDIARIERSGFMQHQKDNQIATSKTALMQGLQEAETYYGKLIEEAKKRTD